MIRRNVLSYEAVCLAITVYVSLAFGAFLAANRVTDPFLYVDVAFVKSVLGIASMAIPRQGPFASLGFVPGREMLMAQYCSMLGISPEKLQYLPLGAIFVSTSMFAVCRRILGSVAAASLLTLYLTMNLSHATALYSVFAYGFALPILCAVILISLETMRDPNIPGVLLLLLLFVGVHLIHYTIATWVILFLLGANVSTWAWHQFIPNARAHFSQMWYILLAAVVIFVAFSEVIYRSYLPLIGAETLDSALQRSLSYLTLTQVTSRSPYLYSRAPSISLISSITLILIAIPVILGVSAVGWHILSKRGSALFSHEWFPFVAGVLALAVVDTMSYAVRGSISTKSWSMVVPILSAYFVLYLKGKRPAIMFASLLLVFSLFKIGVFYEHSYIINSGENEYQSAQANQSADWLSAHMPKRNYVMLADLSLYGKYLVKSENLGYQPIGQGFTPSRYEQVVAGDLGWSQQPDIVAIDVNSGQPTMGYVFQLLAPLSQYPGQIESNQHLNLVYDDGDIWLGVPKP